VGGDDPFRNDHEAALARVDALEVENRELREELERAKRPPEPEPPTPTPTPRVQSTSALLGLVGISIALIAIGVVASLAHRQRDTAIEDSVQRADREFQRRFLAEFRAQTADHSLTGCISQTHEREGIDWTNRDEVGLTARSPWEEYCNPVVRATLTNEALSQASRDRLGAWADAETRLADVRRIVAQLPGSTSEPIPPGVRDGLELARTERAHAIANLQPVLDELAATTPDPIGQLLR